MQPSQENPVSLNDSIKPSANSSNFHHFNGQEQFSGCCFSVVKLCSKLFMILNQLKSLVISAMSDENALGPIHVMVLKRVAVSSNNLLNNNGRYVTR